MKAKIINIEGTWSDVLNSCRTTINKDHINKDSISSNWKRQILLSEHSPIRQISIKGLWNDIKSWVATHFVRHHVGIDHYISTQRTDRTGTNRDELPQGSLVNHEIKANMQAVINISRKRLCNCASKETKEAWENMLEKIESYEPELVKVCVPECIYRGWCYEIKSCGYHKTDIYLARLRAYRNEINE